MHAYIERRVSIRKVRLFHLIFGGSVIFGIFTILYYSSHRLSKPEAKSEVQTVPTVLRATAAPEKKIGEDPLVRPMRSLLSSSKSWIQLITAVYDDRAGLGNYSCVRVILIRDMKVSPMHCLLLDANFSQLPSMKAWFQNIGFGMQYKKSYYREEVLSCCVPRSIHPVHVALIYSNERPSPEMLARLSSDTILRVIYPTKPIGTPRTIMNCVSVTFGSPDPKRVVEWLELQRLLGMDKVEIHDINMSPATRRIFEAYSKERGDGFVELLDINPVLSPDYYNLLHMSPAITNCVLRNMHMYKAIAVFDLDEVIFPRSHDTYGTLMAYLRNLTVAKTHDHIHFIFYNVYYCIFSNATRSKEWTSTFMRFLHHLKPNPEYFNVKSIIDPAACFAMHNHICWANVQHIQPRKNMQMQMPSDTHVDLRIGANQHYKSVCDNEAATNLFEDRTMLKYQRRLDQRLREKFKSLGLSD